MATPKKTKTTKKVAPKKAAKPAKKAAPKKASKPAKKPAKVKAEKTAATTAINSVFVPTGNSGKLRVEQYERNSQMGNIVIATRLHTDTARSAEQFKNASVNLATKLRDIVDMGNNDSFFKIVISIKELAPDATEGSVESIYTSNKNG